MRLTCVSDCSPTPVIRNVGVKKVFIYDILLFFTFTFTKTKQKQQFCVPQNAAVGGWNWCGGFLRGEAIVGRKFQLCNAMMLHATCETRSLCTI